MTHDEYVAQYAQRHAVYWAGATPWRRYKGVLRPLAHPHLEPRSTRAEIRRALAESGTRLAMWTYAFDSAESEWWWIIAEPPYSLERLSPKTRYNIRHGLKHCQARIISGRVLADVGYECYRSAMQRHRQTVPLDKAAFRRTMPGYDSLRAYEVWGLFTEHRLIAYAVYRIIDDVVYEDDTIFDPNYFRCHSSYALLHSATHHYLNERQYSRLICGQRSLSHETSFQEFTVAKLGRRKAYCRLGLEYTPSIRLIVSLVQRLERLWPRIPLPAHVKHGLEVLHRLQAIERRCLSAS